MKKLNRLQINPERIMKEEELKALNGGGFAVCHGSSGICASGNWPCEYAWWYCEIACGGDFSWAACAGY